jgi:DNA modification methylase
VVETAGDELLVVKRTDLALDDGDRARRLAYADNRSSELGLEWDLEQLLRDLEAGFDLTGCGFEEAELAALLQSLQPVGGLTDPDDVPDAPEESVSKLGDIWLLGNHRLMCGDSTDAGSVARLMDGERASLMFTDPPYLVDYQGGNHPQSWANKPEVKDKHWDDYHDPDQATAFFEGFLRVATDEALVKNPAIYQCFGMMRCDLVMAAWRAAGLLPHQVVIWKKSRPVLGRVWFMYDYEPIMAGWHQGDLPDRKPPANERAVWEIAGTEGVEEGVAGTHPTIKPVELVRRPIEWHTSPGELIYEPFSGSGTAIIAAEMTGRRCYALELSPVFVDVAVTRWQNFTGRQAERVEV